MSEFDPSVARYGLPTPPPRRVNGSPPPDDIYERILMIRHGETDDNCEPLRFQGQRDTPLNDRGRAQAAKAAEYLATREVAAIYSSHLSRALETARIIGRRIGLEPIVDPRFAEGFRGDWEGRLFRDVEREEPERYAAWQRAGERWRFPGGESLREHADRVTAGIADVHAAGRLPALIVCHGGTIRTVLCERSDRGLDTFHDWKLPNGSLVEL